MESLPAFLLARILEDESTAREAVKVIESREIAGWYWSGAGDAVFLDESSVPVACGPWKQLMDQPSARHIVRNDPERVLADIWALWKRLAGSSVSWPCRTPITRLTTRSGCHEPPVQPATVEPPRPRVAI